MFRFFRKINQGIRNLIYYFPIIWNDRHWDDFYVFVYLRRKLISMEKFYRHYAHFVGNEKEADKIKLCVMLLNRIVNDDYLENALVFHEKKYGELNMNLKDTGVVLFSTTKELTEEEKKMEDKLRTNLYKHADNQKQQDIDMLFDKMAKHIQRWWD